MPLYPPKGTLFFDGGKNNKFEPTLIEDNEATDCQNVIFDAGSVATREGFQKLNTVAMGSFACNGLFTRKTNQGNQSMLAFYGGVGYVLGTTTFITIGSAQSVFTNGVDVMAAQYENYIFLGNGLATPYKYNEAFTRHGIPAATGVVTASTGAAGVLSGVYSYKITYVNSALVEGDPGDATASITVAGPAQINLASIPVAPQSFGVNARRVYRTVTSGAVYKLVTTLNNNTATTYIDNTADASLGADAPSDNGEPPNYSIIVYHRDRLFVNDPDNPNFVLYSDLTNPYVFPALNFFRVGDNSTDIVRGISVYDNHLIVTGDETITLIYMPTTDPADWSQLTTKSPYGCKSKFCLIPVNNQIMFPAIQTSKFAGFASIEGAAIAPSASFLTIGSVGSLMQSQVIEPDMFNVKESAVAEIHGIVFKNKAWISLTYTDAATANNRVYQYDFSLSNLSKRERVSWVPFTGMNAKYFTEYNGELYFGSSTANGFVYQAETGTYNDAGTAIDSFWESKEYQAVGGEESYQKDFRYFEGIFDNAGDYYMDFTWWLDSNIGPGTTTQVDLDPGGSVWGSMVWGVDPWGGGTTSSKKKVYLAGARGDRIKYGLSNQNTINQRFKVHRGNFKYNLRGLR